MNPALAVPIVGKLLDLAFDKAKDKKDKLADQVTSAIDKMGLDQLRDYQQEVQNRIDNLLAVKPYKLGEASMRQLNTCHPLLQALVFDVIKYIDVSVIKGHRGEAEQNEAFASGVSKVKFPNSKHNQTPSLAVDLLPYVPQLKNEVWNKHEYFYFMAGIVKARASALGIKIRWGGDWNSNNYFGDQNFNDLPHFELAL